MKNKLIVAAKAFVNKKNKALVKKESLKYKEEANAGKFDAVKGILEPEQKKP